MSRQERTARDLKMARRHLRLAIARLDRLHLPIPAAHADLALAKLGRDDAEEALAAFRMADPPPLLQ